MSGGSDQKCCGGGLRYWVLGAIGVALVVLHQDFWNWRCIKPLVFGFIPFGLAYHAGFSIICAVYMWLLVKFVWPSHLESLPESKDAPRSGEGH